MITLILNYITDQTTFTSSLISVLVLPMLYFTEPLPSTITQELNQLAEASNKYNPQLGLATNISNAYEAWLAKEQETASQEALEQLLDDMDQQNTNNYSNFLLNKEDYRLGAELFANLHKKRIVKSRRARRQGKKSSRLSLFSRYHTGGKH